MSHRSIACLLAVAALAACKPASRDADVATNAGSASPSPAYHAGIDADDFAQHVRTLASDEFAGRGPGSDGEARSVAYLEAQFKRLGLRPGNGDSFFQTVPMVETVADENVALKLDVAGKPRELRFGSDMVIGTRTAVM